MADIFELQASLQKTPQAYSARYHGFVTGSITNVNDDQGLVRVKARIAAQGDTEESDWLIPAFPGSMECKPSKGDPCIVGFLDGDPNRGFWLYHPQSTTKNRPTEPMVLGMTAMGILNQVQLDLQNFATMFATHQHSGVTIGSSATGNPTSAPTVSSGKAMASDGSAVPVKKGDNIALSGLCKVK